MLDKVVPPKKPEPFFLGFFQRLRKEAGIELDYSQYSAFLRCFMVTATEEGKEREQLLYLCETTWLTHQRYTAVFRKLFDEAFEEYILNKRGKLNARSGQQPVLQPVPDNGDLNRPATTASSGEENPLTQHQDKASDTTIPDDPAPFQGMPMPFAGNPGNRAEWPEIRVKVKDSAAGVAGMQALSTGSAYNKIPFVFSPDKALPFGLRKTAQLWSKLQTPPQIVNTERLDVPALTRQLTEDGFIHEIKYETQKSGNQHIVWLSDHDGSMSPFSAWENAFTAIIREHDHTLAVDRYFFHDYPSLRKGKGGADFVFFEDRSHTAAIRLTGAAKKGKWNRQTLIIIFSDAGAAHQKMDHDRVKAFFELCKALRKITSRLLWINPVRKIDNSAAEYISYFVEMIYPDDAALRRSIAGLPPLPPLGPPLPATPVFNNKWNTLNSLTGEEQELDRDRLDSFLQTYDTDAHWWMACHLAFPIALSSDLLHHIWINFRSFEDGALMDIPLWVADEVLHSTLITETGHDQYQMYPGIKEVLLQYLEQAARSGDRLVWGRNRKRRLAEFMQEYLRFRRARVQTEALATAETLNYETMLLSNGALVQKIGDLLRQAQTNTDRDKQLQAQQKIEVLMEISKTMGLAAEEEAGAYPDAAGANRKMNSDPDKAGMIDPLALLQEIRELDDAAMSGETRKEISAYHSLLGKLQQTDNSEEGFTVKLPPDIQAQLLEDKIITPPLSSQPTRLFALLVGINDYRQKKLSGCLNDVANMKASLQGLPMEVFIKELKDGEAEKTVVVSAFDTFLSAAGPNDTVLIYMTGVGTEEVADPRLKEPNGRLKCFVCYDGPYHRPADYLINDKEFQYLYQELYNKTGAHIISIYDCAESLGNYPKFLERKTFGHVQIRSITYSGGGPFPQRGPDDYIFSGRAALLSLSDVPRVVLSASVPLGTVIEAQPRNAAQTEGVFTRQLIQELRTANYQLNYRQLESRITSYIKPLYRQTACLYTLLDEELEERNVLNLHLAQGIKDSVIYSDGGWWLGMGLIHGVTNDTGISIVTSDGGSTEEIPCEIRNIYTTRTRVKVADKIPLARTAAYEARVCGLQPDPLKLYLKNYDGNAQGLRQIADELITSSKGYIQLEKTERQADYVLHSRNGQNFITLPNDAYRPLVEPVLAFNTYEVNSMISIIEHIARWRLIKQLKGDRTSTAETAPPLEIEAFALRGQNVDPIEITDGAIDIEYERTESGWAGQVQIRVTNVSAMPLFTCAVFLDSNFGTSTGFITGDVTLLQPGDAVYLGGEGRDRLELVYEEEDIIKDYNLRESIEYLQFISSPEAFEVKDISMDHLPVPFKLNERYTREKTMDIGVKFTDVQFNFRNYTAQLLALNFINPQYNQVEQDRLRALLEFRETADFARGIYYDIETDKYLQPVFYRLKTEISLLRPAPGTENAPGIEHFDRLPVKDSLGKTSRWRLYEQAKGTSKIRMVALGDSWFIYPLIMRDIIDHLAGSFAIQNLVIPAEGLMSSYKTLMERIESEQPEYLLISSGMDELFSHGFPYFFMNREDANISRKQASHLNPSCYKAMENLANILRELFAGLTSRNRSLQIILHGYDYFIPADHNSPVKNWLGQCLSDAGFRRHEERITLVRTVVDAWNDQLSALAGSFSNEAVSFLDLRGTLSPSDWYDELHPNEEGFGKIADRFETLIENIDERSRQKERMVKMKQLHDEATRQYMQRKYKAEGEGVFRTDDPQKGLWVSNAASPYQLAAVVHEQGNGVFTVALSVQKSLKQEGADYAAFILHDSFTPMVVVVPFEGTAARLTISAHEAFALGVLLADGATLEMDLQELPAIYAPASFKYYDPPP
jgi:hypothetical protein